MPQQLKQIFVCLSTCYRHCCSHLWLLASYFQSWRWFLQCLQYVSISLFCWAGPLVLNLHLGRKSQLLWNGSNCSFSPNSIKLDNFKTSSFENWHGGLLHRLGRKKTAVLFICKLFVEKAVSVLHPGSASILCNEDMFITHTNESPSVSVHTTVAKSLTPMIVGKQAWFKKFLEAMTPFLTGSHFFSARWHVSPWISPNQCHTTASQHLFSQCLEYLLGFVKAED